MNAAATTQPAPYVPTTISRTSGELSFSDSDATAAASLGIILDGSIEDRISRAIHAYNHATRYAIEAGYLLLSAKKEIEHGQFSQGIEALGLSSQRASELMRMAKFASSLPDDRRAEMLMLPKSKVLALAAADAEVIADLLADENATDFARLSVRDLRQRIHDLEVAVAQTAAGKDKALAKLDVMAEQARRRMGAPMTDGMPPVVADLRAEISELVKKSELSMESLFEVCLELSMLTKDSAASQWIKPTLLFGLSGLSALDTRLTVLLNQFAEAAGEKIRHGNAKPRLHVSLSAEEIKALGHEWNRLTIAHREEIAQRHGGRRKERAKRTQTRSPPRGIQKDLDT